MDQLIHQTYRDILAEIHAESASKRNNPDFLSNSKESIYFPQCSKNNLSFASPIKFLFTGIAIGSLIVGSVCLFVLQKDSKPAIEAHPDAVSPLIETSLVADVNLMKKILSGLVQSVQTLSEKSSQQNPILPNDSGESFPYPVKIASEKANLRNSPNIKGKSVSILPKDTVLLATANEDGWLKVSTPKGEEAWISQDVVVAKE